MSKILKRIILVLLVFVISIPITSLAVSNGNGKPELHGDEIWIRSWKGGDDWDNADIIGEDVTYRIKRNMEFITDVPRLMKTQGCLCLEHGSNVSHQTDKKIKARVYIEGNNGWIQTYNANVYDNIKGKENIPGSGVTYMGQSPYFGATAYIMARTSKDKILGKYRDVSASSGGKRKELGRQGALWRIARDFMKTCGIRHEGSDYFGTWYNPNAINIINDAVKYIRNVANYSAPKAQPTTITWKKVNGRFVVGPLNFKFSDKIAVVKIDQNGNEYKNQYICDAKGSKIKKIKSQTNFYLSVGTDFSGGKVILHTLNNVYVFDGYIFGDDVGGGQNQLFGYAGEEYVYNNAEIDIALPSLKLVKKDKYTDNAMEGVTFTVKGPNNYSKDVTTGKDGTVTIKPIPTGHYTITEKSINESIGNNWQYEASPSVSATVDVVSGENSVTLKNQKEFINVSGRVFEDNLTNVKGSNDRNNKYGEANDRLIKGVKVRLVYKATGKDVQNPVYTDNDGNYLFKKVRISDIRNGKYNIIFEYDGLEWSNVTANDINSMGGAKSSKSAEKTADRNNFNESFAIIKGKGNSSATLRASGERLNSSKGKTGNLNYSIANVAGTDAKVAKLKTVISEVKLNNGKTIKQIGNGAGGGLESNYYPINADINTAGHTLEKTYKYAESTNKLNNYNDTLIPNNNLGLYRREQPDIAISKDIENIKLSINGKNQIYEYKKRYQHLRAESNNSGYDVGVKFGNKYRNMSYSRPIYESDYKYENADKSKELQVYVTYRLTLNKGTSNLDVIATSIVDYYDKQFELDAIGTNISANGNNISGNVQYTNDTNYNNSTYNKIDINTPVKALKSDEDKGSLYIRFKLTREKVQRIIDLYNSDNNASNDIFINNIAEITSYSTKQNGKTYAGVDRDSNPGNTVPGDGTTYEDDTDKCPSLRLQVATKREVNGAVFIDKLDTAKLNIGYREGNGIYDTREETLSNVLVTYKESESGFIYKTKTLEQDKTNKKFGIRLAEVTDKEAYSISDEELGKTYIIEPVTRSEDAYICKPVQIAQIKKGNYYLADFIPGNYKITFTWGDNEHKVQYWKGTIYNKDRNVNWGAYTTWYKGNVGTRYTDAVDNYNTRKEIDKETNEINYTIANKAPTITKMESTTPGMDVAIEHTKGTQAVDDFHYDGGTYIKYAINNVDFGIVERPKQGIELKKYIKSLRATLANGQVITDAKIENGKLVGNHKYLTYMPSGTGSNGTVKLELDNELIQGTNLEVQYELMVQNTSEIDYATENFYNYGTPKLTNTDRQRVVRLIPKGIIDYLDEDWYYKENKISDGSETNVNDTNGWIYKKLEDLHIDPNVKDTNLKVLYTKYLQNNKLKPEEKASVTIKTSKLLSTTDEIELSNEAEIIEIGKISVENPETVLPGAPEEEKQKEISGGTPIVGSIPGNYNPTDSSISEPDDARAETTVVVPSTGENKNMIIPIGIGLVALVILGVGVVLIKKKTLTK